MEVPTYNKNNFDLFLLSWASITFLQKRDIPIRRSRKSTELFLQRYKVVGLVSWSLASVCFFLKLGIIPPKSMVQFKKFKRKLSERDLINLVGKNHRVTIRSMIDAISNFNPQSNTEWRDITCNASIHSHTKPGLLPIKLWSSKPEMLMLNKITNQAMPYHEEFMCTQQWAWHIMQNEKP